MTANARQPGDDREPPSAQLQHFISIGISQLSPAKRAEADRLLTDYVTAHLEDIAARLLEDVRIGRYTKRFLAGLIGVSEGYLGDALRNPVKLSERVVAMISVTVPGYADAYQELRRRADAFYLPGGLTGATPPAAPSGQLVRVRAVAAKELAAVEAACQRLREALQAVEDSDV